MIPSVLFKANAEKYKPYLIVLSYWHSFLLVPIEYFVTLDFLYFNQFLGAAQPKRWSKSSFLAFFVLTCGGPSSLRLLHSLRNVAAPSLLLPQVSLMS